MSRAHRTGGSDVAVIGAGIVGLSIALELQRRDRSVTVIAPSGARLRASFGNAGVISRGSILPVAAPGLPGRLPRYLLGRDPAVRIRLASLPAALPWAARFLRRCTAEAWREAARALDPLVSASLAHHEALAADLGTEHLIRRTGYLRVYRNAGGLAAAALERAILHDHAVATEELTADGLAELEPHLARRYACGLLVPGAASLQTPEELLARMERAFTDRGGTWRREVAHGITTDDDGATLHCASDDVRAAQVVLAAGARSADLAAQLGDRVPLAAERGYHREVALAGNASLTRPVHDAEGGFVVAPMGDRVRITSGVELARPDDPPDHGQIGAALADAAHSLPFADGTAGRVWMGSRPSTPDGLPVIGRSSRSPRVFHAFGHGHVGLSTGPVTGVVVADLLDGRPPRVPVEPFSPGRFSAA